MRIVSVTRARAQVAVLHLAVLFISVSGRVPSNYSVTPERFRHSRNPNIQWSGGSPHPSVEVEYDATFTSQNLTLREKQLFITHQSSSSPTSSSDCCPSVVEMTEPEGGTNEKGVLVKLYRDAANHQRFYEISCARGVENQECRFVDRKLANQSRCVQKFSYSYALLEDEGDGQAASFPIMGYTTGRTRWMLGYIRVRSGCACTLSPRKSKKTKKRLHDSDGLT